jgi:hypothetical protein
VPFTPEKLKSLRAEHSAWVRGLTTSPGQVIDSYSIIELIDDLDQATQALQFYAEKENWVSRTGKIGVGRIDTTDREKGDPDFPWAGGVLARATLKKIQAG